MGSQILSNQILASFPISGSAARPKILDIPSLLTLNSALGRMEVSNCLIKSISGEMRYPSPRQKISQKLVKRKDFVLKTYGAAAWNIRPGATVESA